MPRPGAAWLRAAGLAAAAALCGCSSVGFYAHFVPYYFKGGAPKADCGQGPDFSYCLHRPPKGVAEDPGAVLYFLHYAGGSERSWGKIPISRAYYAQFKKEGVPAPRVVTVSFGKYWTLFDRPGPKSPVGRFPGFVEKVMPWLEAKLGEPKRRYIWGMSQGGLNGALLILKRPDLWAGAVLSCPAWYTTPLFGAPEEFAAYVKRTGAVASTAEWGRGLVRDRIESPQEWAREDPLVRAAAARDLPPLYINCTAQDDFGFFEGAQAMAKTLSERGQKVTFHPETGLHCQLDAKAASSFLVGLQKSSRPKP